MDALTNAGASSATAAELLELADWRRLLADLYVDVRRLSATDPVAAHQLWRAERERLFREHLQSPVPPADRAGFRARYFPYDPRFRFVVALEPDDATRGTQGLLLPSSGPGALSFQRIGTVPVPFAGGSRRLSVFWMDGYAGGLFLPFRDATNERETYGAGRYLVDGAKSADLGRDEAADTLVLDFNFAYQPSCAFDPRWACPLAPPENRLDLPVRAGERIA